MTTQKYISPELGVKAFHCPHCGTFSHQLWYETMAKGWRTFAQNEQAIARCVHCDRYTVWHGTQMLIPDAGNAPLPHTEMPPDVKCDFDEARSIVTKSPRGAAALLRLAIQRLMPHLGQNGKDLNDDIKNLVAGGLSTKLQRALDTVRVIGNEAVHPGVIELNDTPEIAQSLFKIINMIVETMIAEPKELDALYESLPQSKLEGIEKRDDRK